MSAKTTRFGETLQTLKRLSASYRRCYWKSGAEMLFPMFFGHMAFASHRCWTVYIKKAIFLAAQAWRHRYGDTLRHGSDRRVPSRNSLCTGVALASVANCVSVPVPPGLGGQEYSLLDVHGPAPVGAHVM